MSGPIAERRAHPEFQGCYLSGTATFGNWMVWSPHNDWASTDWYVQRSPADELFYASGSYLFAGVCVEKWSGEKMTTNQPITLVKSGYHKAAYVRGVAASPGYPLWFGGAIGVSKTIEAPVAAPPGYSVGTILDTLTLEGQDVRLKTFVRDFR